jgi:hypothetical protein
MVETPGDHPRKGRRRAPLVWIGGAIAAGILILGVNGTLSSWTDAIINNTHNTVASESAVGLLETGTDQTASCDTATTTTNSATCSTVNKYGGIGTGSGTDASGAQLAPGSHQTASATLTNNGTATGTLTMTPAADCAASAYPGTTNQDFVNYDICNELTVSVTCAGNSPDTSSLPATTAVVLNDSSYAGTAFTIDTALAPGGSTTCTYTLALPSTAPSGFSSQVATQSIQFELTKN